MKPGSKKALDRLCAIYKREPRYLNDGDFVLGTMDALEYEEIASTIKKVNEQRQKKYEKDLDMAAEEFITKCREEWLCD